MSWLVLKNCPTILSSEEEDVTIGDLKYLAEKSFECSTLLDEMKLEYFLENMNKKSLEQIQEFFK